MAGGLLWLSGSGRGLGVLGSGAGAGGFAAAVGGQARREPRLAVGQLEAAGVRVLAVGVGASALVVAQAEGLVPHLGGELRGRRAGRGARLACGLFSVPARAFGGVSSAFAAAALVLALPRAFGRAGALLEQAVYVAADMR